MDQQDTIENLGMAGKEEKETTTTQKHKQQQQNIKHPGCVERSFTFAWRYTRKQVSLSVRCRA